MHIYSLFCKRVVMFTLACSSKTVLMRTRTILQNMANIFLRFTHATRLASSRKITHSSWQKTWRVYLLTLANPLPKAATRFCKNLAFCTRLALHPHYYKNIGATQTFCCTILRCQQRHHHQLYRNLCT